MKTSELLEELDDVIYKLKLRIMFLETNNEQLKKRISELKKFVKEK